MSRGTLATIKIDALKHNFSVVQTLFPQHPILAMVKANAYGHGEVEVARALKQADALGVATLQGALSLRAAGIDQDIVLLAGFQDVSELSLAIQHQLSSVVHSFWQLELLEQHAPAAAIKVWLKIDTGMHRLGFFPEEFPEAFKRLQACALVQKPIGLMTHLATADWLNSSFAVQQVQIFHELAAGHEGPKSVANSAFILEDSELIYPGEWLRPGIMLYGVSPFPGRHGAEYGLRPVMTLQARIMAIKPLRKGDRVGYGGTWQCPEDMLLGVVGIGYGDGYPRSIKNGTPVLVNGVRCAVVGRVSMDMITIDLRPYPKAHVGETVVLWGENLPIEEIAANADGFSYEMLSGITARVERVFA